MGKTFKNIDNMKPKDRFPYIEQMMAWYEEEYQQAPQLTRWTAM